MYFGVRFQLPGTAEFSALPLPQGALLLLNEELHRRTGRLGERKIAFSSQEPEGKLPGAGSAEFLAEQIYET